MGVFVAFIIFNLTLIIHCIIRSGKMIYLRYKDKKLKIELKIVCKKWSFKFTKCCKGYTGKRKVKFDMFEIMDESMSSVTKEIDLNDTDEEKDCRKLSFWKGFFCPKTKSNSDYMRSE